MSLDTISLFMSVDEIAGILQRSERTIWRWRSAGLIPQPVKVSGTVLWNRAEVLQWIAAGCPGAATPQPTNSR